MANKKGTKAALILTPAKRAAKRASDLRSYHRNKERTRARKRCEDFRRKYGISAEEVDAMAEKQEQRCAICCLQKPLHVDHCHSTGAVRGLLCFDCNTAVGKLNDDPELLRRAIEYLK